MFNGDKRLQDLLDFLEARQRERAPLYKAQGFNYVDLDATSAQFTASVELVPRCVPHVCWMIWLGNTPHLNPLQDWCFYRQSRPDVSGYTVFLPFRPDPLRYTVKWAYFRVPISRLLCCLWDHNWSDVPNKQPDDVWCRRCLTRMSKSENERGLFLKPFLQNLGTRIIARGRGDLGPSLAEAESGDSVFADLAQTVRYALNRRAAYLARCKQIFTLPKMFYQLPLREIEFMRASGLVYVKTSPRTATKVNAPGAGNVYSIDDDELVYCDPSDFSSEGAR